MGRFFRPFLMKTSAATVNELPEICVCKVTMTITADDIWAQPAGVPGKSQTVTRYRFMFPAGDRLMAGNDVLSVKEVVERLAESLIRSYGKRLRSVVPGSLKKDIDSKLRFDKRAAAEISLGSQKVELLGADERDAIKTGLASALKKKLAVK